MGDYLLETFSATLRDETDMGRLERRPGRSGNGDDAAGTRIIVVAPG